MQHLQERLEDRLPVKPVLATIPGPDPLWNRYVEDYFPSDAGSFRDYGELLKRSKGRRILILNGSVGLKQRYRDLLFAMLVKFRRRRPLILIQDATWEPTSETLVARFPFLKPFMPIIAKTMIKLLDGPHVRYAVLSTSEVETFPHVWGVDPDRVVFQPFPNTLHDYRDMPTADEGYLFSGGNSKRDYGLLEKALEGAGIETRVAARWQPSKPIPGLDVGVTDHEKFMTLLANARAVVVPLRRTVRSAGQQTYLNAMGLGKPVVVVDAPGVRDYIINGVTGVIVPPDVTALRSALKHVMDPANADYYRQMGSKAREDVFSRFTEEHFRHGLLKHAGIISEEQYIEGTTKVASTF